MKVGVVLVNWNAGDLTMACIDALLAGHRAPDRIVVVDNGSRDGFPDRLGDRDPRVTVRHNAENLGFAEANNQGIRDLRREGVDAVWILNNDTVVEPDALAVLVDALERRPEAGAVTAKILDRNSPPRLWYAGGDLSPATLAARHRGLGQADRGQCDREEPITFVSGCCLLARTTVFATLGGFHPAYFAYHEDVEWCWRALRRGVPLWYVPRAVIHHHVSASLRRQRAEPGRVSARAHYLEARNRLFTIRLHGRGIARAVALGHYLGRTLWLTAGLLARGRGAKLAALGRGLRDGLRTPLEAALPAGPPSSPE